MSRQYANFIKRLRTFEMKVLTTEQEFIKDKKNNKYPELEMECPSGHTFKMRVSSLHNKVNKAEKEGFDGYFCAQCNVPEISGEECRVREVCAEFDFKFISYDKETRNVEYKCCCGNISITHACNLNRKGRKAQCPKCQGINYYGDSDIKERFEAAGCELLEDYLGRYEPVLFKCSCGKNDTIKYVDFVRGKRCTDCTEKLTCEHSRIKTSCIICAGRVCEHGIDNNSCQTCSSRKCKHGKFIRYCKECYHGFCEHGREKKVCIDCDPKKACNCCGSVFVHERSKYFPFCARCYYVKLHPEHKIAAKYRLKEQHFLKHLKETFENVEMLSNKTLQACSSYRPDAFIECMTHVIIIECDENQHRGYPCENKRMMELFNDIACRPLVMIRFNPDKYTDIDGNKIDGCFKENKIGGFTIIEKEWVRRTTFLSNIINRYLKEIPNKEITLIQLYYDGFQETSIKL